MISQLRRSLVLLAVAAVPAAASSHPSFWRYAHPQAKVLVGIEWQRVMNSPPAQRMREEMAKEGWTRMLSSQGLDFIWDIERVFVSSPGGSKNQPPLVAAVQGRFDLAKVRQAIHGQGAQALVYRGVALLRNAKPGADQCMALVSPQVLLFGDRASVQAALDHYAAATPPPASRLYQRASDLSARYDLWFVGTASPQDFAAAGLPELVSQVESFEAGLSLQQGLGLDVNLNAKTAESAQALASTIQGFVHLAAMQGGGRPEAAEFLNKLRVNAEQARVTVSLAVDQAELDRAVQQMRASVRASVQGGALARMDMRPRAVARGVSNPPAATAVVPAPPPKPAEPAVIRIYGAEGGTREIPFKQP